MRENLTIRAYEPIPRTHSHDFHQVVVPLQGAINIRVGDALAEIGIGHCVIIQKSTDHSFQAGPRARFLVADLLQLPDAAKSHGSPFAAVSNAFKSFCLFADIQVSSKCDSNLEDSMIAVFRQLLSIQNFLPAVDIRISRALRYIESDLSADCTLEKLANFSCLSVSQFKRLFTKNMGLPLGKYILIQRMEKARALLMNTDMPIGIVGEMAGYANPSAFARRFQAYHGSPPREYKSRSDSHLSDQHRQ